MNREQLAIGHLSEGWDSVVVLCSRYRDGRTECYRSLTGNGYAIQQMLEDEVDNFIFGGEDGSEEKEEAGDN